MMNLKEINRLKELSRLKEINQNNYVEDLIKSIRDDKTLLLYLLGTNEAELLSHEGVIDLYSSGRICFVKLLNRGNSDHLVSINNDVANSLNITASSILFRYYRTSRFGFTHLHRFAKPAYIKVDPFNYKNKEINRCQSVSFGIF